jgi:peroxiredoxin
MSFFKRRKLLEVGARAPEFRLARLGGGEVSLSGILAKGPAALAFFKISCPVCQFTFPYLERLAAGGIAIYGISQNGADHTTEFAESLGVTFSVLLDSEEAEFPASNAFGISTVPTIFVVEADGVISRVIEGWTKMDMLALGERAGIAPFRQAESVPQWKAG